MGDDRTRSGLQGDYTRVLFPGERCWVVIKTGDENNGTGELANVPVGDIGALLGDTIRYSGGTDETWPRFVEKV